MNGFAKAIPKSDRATTGKQGQAVPAPSDVTQWGAAEIGLATFSRAGFILDFNLPFSAMLGIAPDELVTLRIHDFGPADLQPLLSGFNELANGSRESIRFQGRWRRADGSYFWGRLALTWAYSGDGQPAKAIAMLEDTTHSRQETDKSVEAEKMEVMGRLAGGIAHDFNNLLTGVLLYCDLLSDRIGRESPLRKHVEEIRAAAEQGAALTRQLLAVVRKAPPHPQVVQLNDVVSSTHDLLRRLMGEQNELVLVLAPRLGQVRADPAQLRQVLLNLALNARDAMPQGGQITVRTRSRPAIADAPAAICLIVEDQGCGMNEATRSRLFEPFFTTKTRGHGTGLGLATVQRIVAELQGTIAVRSTPGQGTRMEVSFPVAPVALGSGIAEPQPSTAQTVLLVEDHASDRVSNQRILREAGFRVLPAATAKQALRVFQKYAPDVSLLLADGMMPGMSGRSLADVLLLQKPELKVLLISSNRGTAGHRPHSSVGSIRKPFAGRSLLKRVREVLDSKAGSLW